MTRYKENIYACGDYLDIQVYPVYKKAGKRKGKFQPSSEIQKKLNDKNSEKYLKRLIHLNFCRRDYAIHLTYADGYMPDNEEQSKKDVQNYIRRVKRLYQKQNIKFKYIWVTETGEKSERIHHHLIFSGGIDRNLIEDLWQKGYANSKKLKFTKNGLAGLAHYITKQKLYFRRFNTSKNLSKPSPKERTGRIRKADIEKYASSGYGIDFEKIYPGYALCEKPEPLQNEINFGFYMEIRMYRKGAEYAI